MARIAVVSGMIATYPVGGVVWDYGQYALGLEELGYEVYYLEDTGGPTYDPNQQMYGEDPAFAVDFLARSLAQLSPALGRRWHFRSMNGQTFGLTVPDLARIMREAELFINVSGSALLRDEYMPSRRKILIDSDPGYNHFVNYPKWDKSPGWQGTHGYRAHDFFFTYAEKIGQPDCLLPTLGLPWQPTRPVVVLDRWQPRGTGAKYTTVMTWDNFRKPIEAGGVTYGTKEREFIKVEALPAMTAAPLELAVGGASPPVERWRKLGWSVVDSHAVSRTAEAYREYIETSRGEFSVGKNVYVATRSGWFSCRSICYLAAGRPVVVQDTGFSDIIPTGAGLFAFATLEQAVAALRAIEANYAQHAAAARALAQSHFSPPVVLGDMLQRIGAE